MYLLGGSCLVLLDALATGSYLERTISGVDVEAREEADSRSCMADSVSKAEEEDVLEEP